MTLYQIEFVDEDGVKIIAESEIKDECIHQAWKYFKADHGPLATEPWSFDSLADKVADAFGGECEVVMAITKS